MKKKPIIFNSEMVRAILDGRKTQTRRLIKYRDYPFFFNDNVPDFQKEESIDLAPYKVGDVLYVRETFYNDIPEDQNLEHIYYRADGECCEQIPECQCAFVGKPRWIPSIHMPEWAHRIELEVTRVRVERAKDISEEDARTEGCESKREFLLLWQSIYGHFAEDKWCWVYDFRRVK